MNNLSLPERPFVFSFPPNLQVLNTLRDIDDFSSFFFFFFNIYLFGCTGSLRCAGSLVVACRIFFFQLWHTGSLGVACGIQFPDQGSNLGPLHWQRGVLPLDHQGSLDDFTSDGSSSSLLLIICSDHRCLGLFLDAVLFL